MWYHSVRAVRRLPAQPQRLDPEASVTPPFPTANLPVGTRPRLLMLIDVEEEFDWGAPFDRTQRAATHVPALAELTRQLAPRQIVPCGVITHPVADDPRAAAVLAELVGDGRLEPGAHLHPWVTPPHDEPVTGPNSFPGNLPPALEAAKLAALTERIEQSLGERPRVYQAGRYGIGPHTAATLVASGYQVDTSLAPPFDYRSESGPDFTGTSPLPVWMVSDPPLLSVPITGALLGHAGALTRPLYKAATSELLAPTRLAGLLAKAGLAERLRLSPEGQSLDDMQRLTRALLSQGCRVFTVSFHSPSLVPGHTSYVTNEAERQALLGRLLGYCDWFLGELDGEPSSALGLHELLLACAPPPGVRAAPPSSPPADS